MKNPLQLKKGRWKNAFSLILLNISQWSKSICLPYRTLSCSWILDPLLPHPPWRRRIPLRPLQRPTWISRAAGRTSPGNWWPQLAGHWPPAEPAPSVLPCRNYDHRWLQWKVISVWQGLEKMSTSDNKLNFLINLVVLVANLAKTKWCKKPEKWLKPWQMGTHLRVLSKSFPMNTNMAVFRRFSEIFVLWTKLASALEGLIKSLKPFIVTKISRSHLFLAH